ncbi:unnamed protein product [marine sediment metagenome]|uniref:Uncharacterized protein n=1 Tax=marine sediment metagenome TaxID=412755 RepID=X1QZY0_9ZZZZ
MRREWIKLYMADWLDNGFTSFLTPAQLGVAAKLWALAGRMSTQGVIKKRPGAPFTLNELSARLHFDKNLVKATLGKLEDYGFIIVDPEGIHWTYWDKDQPDYGEKESRRQLPPDTAPAPSKPTYRQQQKPDPGARSTSQSRGEKIERLNIDELKRIGRAKPPE